ncbi:GH92 family glycosyl hydrolase [Pseudalkalibacillus caeni]|uniref:GH92 family glycosyl hydrolase n=1 Tax=Exobacillus caeni TaxID=2574798 RepID=UPI00148566AF|nr:GH92 family glycosyl hydrolase [Pseudalkalibacillus caeni]
MKKRYRSRFFVAALCLSLLAPMLPVSHDQLAKAEDNASTDFFTSFEEGDPQPDWESTVETDASGNKKSSGVIGNVPYETIQGDVTDQVKKVTASASNAPNEIEANLIDRSAQTKWLAFEPTAWLQFQFAEPQKIVKYAFTSANDAPGRDPKSWKLYGSNDGESWTEIDSRSDESFEKRFQRKIYEFNNDKSYTYYKFDITENSGDGLTQLAEVALSNGIDAPPPVPSDMKTQLSDGPTSSYTGKTNVGWSGKKALTYEGEHTLDGRAYSYNKVLDVNIKVEPETALSYMIHPQFMDQDQLDYSSTYVSIDLAFTDGSYLSELDAVDQHGVKLAPQEQGKSKTLYPNQWNYKKSVIGEVASGKTIDRILIAYDKPEGPGVFKGSIDDIKIGKNTIKEVVSSPADYVDILRGTNSNSTFSRGNNFPAVAIPHGFNFWTPATNAGTTSWLYSYQQSNNSNNLPELQAFSLSHEPSPWMGDRQTFQVMPSASTEMRPTADRKERALAFKHENEIAKPYYYNVKFENGIQTELAPTNRAAMFKFSFTGNTSNLIFDNVNNNGGLTLNPDSNSLSGYTDVRSGLSAGATRMFIYAEFDKPVTESGRLTGEDRDNVSGFFRFDTSSSDKTVTMKIATSLLSVEQAKKNLSQDIKEDDSFEDVKERAKELWNDKLSIIEVEGASKEELVTLYSNMYRLFLYPNIGFENTGTEEKPVYQYASPFSGPTGENTATKTGAKIVKGKPYVNNGFWDTYRTSWPAYTLLTPTEAGEMIDGFVQQYKDGGWISRWSSPGYANLMVGTSSDVAFADAYLKGVRNFDVPAFYDSAIKNAAVASENASVGRKGLATSIFDGYTSTATGEGMSWAMDGYINDFAIANMAKVLSKKNKENEQYQADYHYYINRAKNYVNMFNSNVEFFMGREPSGEWRSDPDSYNPEEWGGDYTETNAWNMAFHVPQDGQGLANLYGGREELAEKLDQFFSTPETALQPGHYGGVIHEMREARDVRMGMYGHSNQPSHHIPYMYNYAGQPWKTQEKVREVLSRLYIGSEIGQGYPGDEDNGEMSAWYLFSAAGFYPLQMGLPEYAIGAPYFKKMTIHLQNGKDLVINAPDVSDKNQYIQSLKVNGKLFNKLTISHELIAQGGTLDFKMGEKPSDWGTGKDALPKSITSTSTNGSSLVPDPLHDLTDKTEGVSHHSDKGVAKSLFDNSSNTEISFANKNPWIQYYFPESPELALMYTVTAGDDETQAPKEWVLIGSKDGKNWTILDEREREEFKWNHFTKPFKIQNPGKYSYYRLIVKDNGGNASTSLAEIEFLGYSDVGDKFDEFEKIYNTFAEEGKVKGALKKKLDQSLRQIGDQLDKEHFEQAIKHSEKFLKQLSDNNPGSVSSEVKEQLDADIHALMECIARISYTEKNKQQEYDGDVQQVPVFEISNLKTEQVNPGENASVSAEVSNIGFLNGEKQIDFYFDGELVESKTITLEAGDKETVSFSVKAVELGIHQVKINELTGTLKALYIGKPVLSLTFDEEKGDTVTDHSPYGHDGKLFENATLVAGKFGNAVKLDGGWVEVPSSELLNGGDDFTISAWVNLENATNDQKLIGKTSIGNGYVLGVNKGLYPEVWSENGRYSFNQGEVPSNEWAHLAMTWSKNGRIKGYVNGKEVANSSASSTTIKPNDMPLIIGGAPWGPSGLQVKGLVDEVKIYKEALTAEQIGKLYNNNTLD